MSWEKLPATLSAEDDERSVPELCLLVIGPDGVTSHPLPDKGTLTIGRAEDSEIRIDHPSVSRLHARIHLGESLSVEDLGSANGTRLAGARMDAKASAPIRVGSLLEIGPHLIVVQLGHRRWGTERRLVPHAHFEARLAEECRRARPSKRSVFAVLRLHVVGGSDPSQVGKILGQLLKADDLVASYAPGEYALLIGDVGQARADRLADLLLGRFADAGFTARVGVAVWPIDGRDPEALVGAASSDLNGAIGPADVEIVARDQSMIDLLRVVDRIAQGTISVLIVGETGVGKEVIAAELHRRSPRRDGPFVKLNSAALAESVVDSELFGHEVGAFTGADKARVGLLELASGGTLFLDEVGELPAATQAKLLRALEQREVLPVGGSRPRPIDVRFVSATNRDLEAEASLGRFRTDLYFRIAGVVIQVPPLRSRPSEIEPLIRLFLGRVCRDLGWPRPPVVSQEALAQLKRYAWPGNARELRNVVERAALLCGSDEIGPEHLPIEKLTLDWTSSQTQRAPPASLDDPDEEAKARIADALERCAGNQTRAAELLGISRRTLSKWLDRHQLPRPRKRGPK